MYLDIFVYDCKMYTNTKPSIWPIIGIICGILDHSCHAAVIMEIDIFDTFKSPGPILSPEYDM